MSKPTTTMPITRRYSAPRKQAARVTHWTCDVDKPTRVKPEQLPADSPELGELMQMMTYKRAHGSASETAFLERFILPLEPTLVDPCGNLHFDRRVDNANRTLFVAHVDSVHHTEGRQTVTLGEDGRVTTPDGECLGADDAAGVAILLNLMRANVPAYYIFTRGEERGGIGAGYLAERMPDLLRQFDRAIAFDRRDTFSVITHQGARCCSDAFAEALSAQLNQHDPLMFMPDATGIYTDTAEFVDFIPECTNISVAYWHEHTQDEYLDATAWQALCATAALVNWDSLPVERDPNVREAHSAWGWGSYLPSLTSGAYADWPDADDELEAQRVDDIDWLLDSMGYMGLDAADLNYDELTAASAACEFIYDGRDTELRELLKTHAQCELQIPAAMDAETLKEWLEQCLIAGVSVATRALANVIKGE